MKDLKYIKLFEAFESTKLSKTMGFISRESRAAFLSKLKDITGRLDYPLSNLSDDLFEYLPFKSALKKTVSLTSSEPEQCNHPSDSIPCEICQGGRVKRVWGNGTRTVTCKYCNGSGFKPAKRVEPELDYIKFWFDKDGKYILTTGTDGQVRKQNKKLAGTTFKGSKFSRNLADYNQLNTLSVREVQDLQTGTIIRVKFAEYGEYVIGMVWRGVENDNCYIIQDDRSGGSDPDTREWQNYGESSWSINSGNDMSGEAYLLELKDKPNTPVIVEPKEDPYSLNGVLNTRYLTIDNNRDMEERLKGAHFAIILDFKKLKSSKFETIPTTKRNRKERIKGTLALQKPEDIKKANIQRYIQALADKFNTENGLSELTKVMPRALGWNNSITFVLRGINLEEINRVIGDIYSLMKNPRERVYETRIRTNLKEMYEKTGIYNQQINKNIQDIYKLADKKDIKTFEQDPFEKKMLVFTKYLELGEILNKKISSMPSETIGDLEIIYQKILSLKNVYRNDRFNDLRRMRYVIEYLSHESGSRHVFSEIVDLTSCDAILVELEEFKKIIER
jgi:hypothetical protein